MTRRRYRFNEETQALEEIGLDVELPARVELMTGGHYEGLRATDGTPIDTARRHREYMKANNVTLADDFKKAWADAPAKRAAEARAGLREAVGRAAHQLESRRRR